MFKKEVLERFLRYAVINTMSDEHLAERIHPSTEGQWELLRLLEKELKAMAIEDVTLDEHGYLIGHMKGNCPNLPTIGFCAHVDTAHDVMGNNVKPRVIEQYDGNDIKLNDSYTICVKDNKELLSYIGTTLVVTDGNTLLGSDDKAGVAEIMTALNYLSQHKEIKHGEIEILFSPDEETGFGMDFLNMDKIRAQAMYTVDGGTRYEIESECFNAATVKVSFQGVSYHLGAARGRYVNAITMAAAFINSLPQNESPEATDGRYGYYSAQEITGTGNVANVTVYLRDFDYSRLEQRIEALKVLGRTIEMLFYGGKVTVEAKISSLNMGEAASKNPKAIEVIEKAGKVLNQNLHMEIIRGGTDGARIAQAKGIPCPNIYTGGHNLHSQLEWASVDGMNDAVQLIVEIIKMWAV